MLAAVVLLNNSEKQTGENFGEPARLCNSSFQSHYILVTFFRVFFCLNMMSHLHILLYSGEAINIKMYCQIFSGKI